jgi:cytochrome c peroxidase
MSCSSCHLQANSFECGINHPEYTGGFTHGITGIPTPHVMLPMINLVWNPNGYLWNGMIHQTNTNLFQGNPDLHYRNLESLVWMGIVAPHEMNGSVERTVETIAAIPMYAPMFKAAFGTEEVTIDRICKAIAQFVRTLISSDSNFDRYLRGDYQLTQSELRGFVLFTTEEGADCFHCHGGEGNPLFTTNLFYNNGKDADFSGPNFDPRDRYAYTGDPTDIGAYKATTLRNIDYTGPYMHDGRFSTLEEVLEFYSSGLVWSPYVHPLMHKISDGGAELIPQEKQDVLNFIRTLEDTVFLTNPDYANPRPTDPYFIN